MPQTLSVSIGVFAYNEENNIGKIINSILKQKTETAEIKEILIISSGSHDKTDQIIRQLSKKDSRIKLVNQLKREGKSSAINLFLKKSASPILIVVSGDLKLHSQAIEEITLPFLHESVGMVGAHPIPRNTRQSKIGSEIKLLWQLHHLVSLHYPKCGEMVAFRKVIRSIPKQSAVDEVSIEVLLKLIGYKIVYAPRSIVYNKGPRTVKEFLTQRRRVYSGHKWIGKKYNYEVSTMNFNNVFTAITDYLTSNPSEFVPLIKLLLLEAYGRALGWIDFYIFGKNPYVWKMIKR